MKLRLRSLLLPLALALPLVGCKQGIGDRCQLDSDCDSGRCLLPTNNSPQQGGTCQPALEAGVADMAVSPAADLSVAKDAGATPEDMAAAADLADSGTPD